MRGLRLRYRHEITCTGLDCGARLAGEGETSDALYPDGSPVSTPGFDFQNSTFELTCKSGHLTTVHYPKDVMLLKSAAIEGDQTAPPAVLRR